MVETGLAVVCFTIGGQPVPCASCDEAPGSNYMTCPDCFANVEHGRTQPWSADQVDDDPDAATPHDMAHGHELATWEAEAA